MDGMKPRQQQVKQKIAKQLKAAEHSVDVFELLNNNLNKTSAAVERTYEEKEVEKLEVSRSL